MTKYQKFYELMEAQNQKLFDMFQTIHDGYKQDKEKYADQFHTVGRDVLDIMRDWERRLCAGMERGVHGAYSNKLAEKFWQLIKKRFTHIDLVGIKSSFK